MLAPAPVSSPVPAPLPAPGALSADSQQVLEILHRCAANVEAANLNANDRKKVEDARKKLSKLEEQLASNSMSPTAFEKLQALAQALESQNYPVALQHQVSLISNDWNENKNWLPAVKNLVQMAQSMNL
eukprot:TRINITY_DN4363_c0_g1_i11.p1 TRINITY_DN4363_c0_g1~~TRINITY_DN4363_c0_g1_i11.p1  ORF type:complete len:129 (+),score=42.11 TRINITY_DN4363_c0_g1_i11:90-476(+)